MSELFGRSSFSFRTADARVMTCDVEADLMRLGRDAALRLCSSVGESR